MQMRTAVMIAAIAALAVAAKPLQWSVTNSTNFSCILVQFDVAHIKLSFENLTDPVSVLLNATTNVRGSCFETHEGKPASVVEAEFLPNGVSDPKDAKVWNIKLWFTNGDDKDKLKFKLADYVLTSNDSDRLNTTYHVFNKSANAENDMGASENNAYKCSATGLALVNGTIEFSNLQVIANAIINGTQFPQNQLYQQCALDAKTSDVVPIVVGACLAGLVVIVLIAYLIGRARAKRQGYASV